MNRKLITVVTVVGAIFVCKATKGYSQEDILDLASKLTDKSAELQKVQENLVNKREEIKKEAVALKAEEKKVKVMKAAKAEDTGPVVGPFRLFLGKYSNTADLRGGGKGQEFKDFAQAREKGEKHMKDNATNQPSYRIEDRNGKRIEYAGIFGRKKLNREQIERTNGSGSDKNDLDAAVKALDERKNKFYEVTQKYRQDKAAYDQDLADYNTGVDQLKSGLPDAIREVGLPVPSAEDLKAPKGDFQVPDLGALRNMKGKTTKDGTAANFVQSVANVPNPSKWGKGTKVEGAKLRPGTPIATFKPDGSHSPGKGAHSAIYVTQNRKGIWVYDQYKTPAGKQRPVDTRFIRFKKGKGSPSNDASAYSVIKKGVAVPDLPPDKP